MAEPKIVAEIELDGLDMRTKPSGALIAMRRARNVGTCRRCVTTKSGHQRRRGLKPLLLQRTQAITTFRLLRHYERRARSGNYPASVSLGLAREATRRVIRHIRLGTYPRAIALGLSRERTRKLIHTIRLTGRTR